MAIEGKHIYERYVEEVVDLGGGVLARETLERALELPEEDHVDRVLLRALAHRELGAHRVDEVDHELVDVLLSVRSGGSKSSN